MAVFSSPSPQAFGPGSGYHALPYTVDLGYADPGDAAVEWIVSWGDGYSNTYGDIGSASHIYGSSGTFTINAQVTNDDSCTAYAEPLPVSISDPDPLVWACGAGSVDEGSAYELDVGFLDPLEDPVNGYAGFWGDGTSDSNLGETDSFTHIYDLPSDYTITVHAANNRTQVSCVADVTVDDVQGQVDLAGPESTDEGSEFALTFGYGNAAGDALSAIDVDWGDGLSDSYDPTDTNFTHTYSDNGDYLITVTATDDDDQAVASTLDAIVNEVVPFVAAFGEGTAEEGSDYTVFAGYTDPADALSGWTVDWGDGLTDSYGPEAESFTHAYSDPGHYDITAYATDDDGQVFASSTVVTVLNTTPAVTAVGASATVAAGEWFSVTATFDDPAGDVTGWWLNWGDGSTEHFDASERTFSHAYAHGDDDNHAVYGITVAAVAEDGIFTAATGVKVTGGDSVCGPSGRFAGISVNGADEWSPADLYIGFCVALGSEDPSEYFVDWGDGSTETVAFEPQSIHVQHVYQHEGLYPVTVDAGWLGADREWMGIGDIAANLDPLHNVLAAKDDPVDCSAVISSSDVEDVKAAFIDCGDGKGPQPVTLDVTQISGTLAHAPASGGTFAVMVYDVAGKLSSAQATIEPVSLKIGSYEAGDPNALIELTLLPDGTETGAGRTPLHLTYPTDLPDGSTVELSINSAAADKVEVWNSATSTDPADLLLGGDVVERKGDTHALSRP